MANKANKQPVVPAVINCGIKSIQVYNGQEGTVRYRVTIDQEIDAIKRDGDDYVEAKVNYIDFVPSVLIAQCINHIAGLDMMYTKKKETALRNGNGSGFGAAELQVVLTKAKLTIERAKFEAGDEYTTQDGETFTHDNAGYNTNITDIKVSERVQANLDKMMDNVFEL